MTLSTSKQLLITDCLYRIRPLQRLPPDILQVFNTHPKFCESLPRISKEPQNGGKIRIHVNNSSVRPFSYKTYNDTLSSVDPLLKRHDNLENGSEENI